MLERIQHVHRVAAKNKTLISFTEHYYCPCFVCYKKHYRLTQSALECKEDSCCGTNISNIDLTSIRDLDFTQTCCRSWLTIFSSDRTNPELRIPLSRGGGMGIFKTLKRAWESDQTHMAGSRGQGAGGGTQGTASIVRVRDGLSRVWKTRSRSSSTSRHSSSWRAS